MTAFVESVWTTLLALAPWLLLGMLVAALMHGFLPKGFIHRQLTGPMGVVKAVLLGVPLPLCSCGVIPAGLGLKKDGASDGAAVGFLISTPQTGVDSILVSASFLGWPFALFKVAAAAITGLVGGLATDAFSNSGTVAAPAIAADQSRPTMREMLDHGLMIVRTIWRWVAFGVIASALIETFVPESAFAQLTAYGTVVPVLGVLLVAVPLYVCATASVPIAAALVAAGLPAGAALVFLMAGPATNLATIGAISRTLGKRALVVYLVTIIGGSVGLALAFDFVIDPSAVMPAHEHGGATWWALGSAVALLAMMAWFAVDELRGWLGSRGGSSTTDSTVEVGVEGMSCNGCVKRLQAALTKQEGVSSAEVVLEPGKATVRGTLSADEVCAAIEEAGYTPHPLG